MEIRRMSEADVFDVAAIEAKVFSQPWSEQGFRDALAMNHVIFLVAEEAGSILGYCGMYMALDEGEITNVAISEACRNRGYGEQLVTELMQQGRKHGIRRYVLEVRVSNDSLYGGRSVEHCGYIRCTGGCRRRHEMGCEQYLLQLLDRG